MLLEALLHTFHGKYFYFGFKLNGTSDSQSPTLKDVLQCTSDESQTHSQFENDFENSHTLVYQILSNSASSQITVTDHMRKAVYMLKHGHTSAHSVSHRKDVRSTSTLSQLSSSRSDSVSSCKNSYIDNSKQESVVFSFEESDTGCKSRSRSQNRDLFVKENQSNITCRKSGRTQGTDSYNSHTFCLNLNGTFSQNIYVKNKNQSCNMEADITSTFTNEIIKQLEYSTGELGVSNTSSRIDRELRERDIKRKVENLSRCILLSQQSKQESQRELLNLESVRNKNQNVKYSEISDNASVSNKQISPEAENVKLNIGCSKQSLKSCNCCGHNLSTDHTLSKADIQNLVADQEDSQSLTAFLESQTVVTETEASSCKEQKAEVQGEGKIDNNHEFENWNNSILDDGSLKIHSSHNERENTNEKNNTVAQVAEVVRDDLPYSEGLETFFGTQFTDEIIDHFAEEEEEEEEEEVDDNTESHKEASSVSVDQKEHLQNETCATNPMPAGDFIDLPESKDLEAFLSTFDDGIKDSGLYSDNTATSVEHKQNYNDYVSEEKTIEKQSQGKVSFQKAATTDNSIKQGFKELPVPLNDQVNTDCVIKSGEPSKGGSINYTIDSELDSFLANITDEFKVNEEGNIKTCEVSQTSSNIHVQSNKRCPQNCTSNSNVDEASKVIAYTNCKDEYYLDKELINACNKNSLCKTSTSSNESLDLEEYLDRINTSNVATQNFDKAVVLNPALIQIPANERFGDSKPVGTDSVQEIVCKEKENISEVETCAEYKETKININEELNDIQENSCNRISPCFDRIDSLQNGDGQVPLQKDSGTTVGEKNVQSTSLNDNNTLFLSDNSLWDKTYENSQSLYSDLDNALISMQNNSVASADNSVSETDTEYYNEKANTPGLSVGNSTHVGSPLESLEKSVEHVNQNSLPVNSSFDLFEDSYCTPNVKERTVPQADQENVLVGDGDIEEIENSSFESDDSMIIDSPNTVIDDKYSRGDNLATLFRSKMHVPAKKREETGKNVKFHRQLRRVSSCQLMDIKMKLNVSPHRNRKVRRKSILKVKHNDKLKLNSPHNDHVSFDKNRDCLDVLEEKSHLLTTKNTVQDENSCDAFVGGSQDLFADSEEIVRTTPSPTEIVNDILDKYIETRKATEKLKEPDANETNDSDLEIHTNSAEKMTSNSIAENSGSQDLFSQRPPVNDMISKQLTSGGSPDLNVMCTFENKENHVRPNTTDYCMVKEFKKPTDDACILGGQNSNQIARKQTWLRDVLLDVTNTPNDFYTDKNKTYVQQSKHPGSKCGHQIIVDTPDLNACQNVILPVFLNGHVTERETLEMKDIGEQDVVKGKEGVILNCGINTSRLQNSDVCVEVSPDLFADSPDTTANKVSSHSKSNVRLYPALLRKKLFS